MREPRRARAAIRRRRMTAHNRLAVNLVRGTTQSLGCASSFSPQSLATVLLGDLGCRARGCLQPSLPRWWSRDHAPLEICRNKAATALLCLYRWHCTPRRRRLRETTICSRLNLRNRRELDGTALLKPGSDPPRDRQQRRDPTADA